MHLGLGIKSKLLYKLEDIYIYIKNGFAHKTILFYPQNIYNVSMMKIIVNIMHYRTTNNPNDHFDLAISWDYDTHRKKHPLLEEISTNKKVINLECLDVSKTGISQVFAQIFGYEIMLDPKTHTGPAVKKSELNALHNGEVIQCPITNPEEGFNYSKLIDSSVDENYTVDLRVLFFDGEIPCIYKRYKGIDNRFDAKNIKSKYRKWIEACNVEDVFSKDEINKLTNFCRA
ncbi:MAG: hypothetical protein ACOCQ4_03540, partial [bacterium]